MMAYHALPNLDDKANAETNCSRVSRSEKTKLICDAAMYMSENRAENCEAGLVLNWKAILPIVSLPYILTQFPLLAHKSSFGN
jgi:hypothetical protein